MGYAGGSGGLDEAAVNALIASGAAIKKAHHRSIVAADGNATLLDVEFAAGELTHDDKIVVLCHSRIAVYFQTYYVMGVWSGGGDGYNYGQSCIYQISSNGTGLVISAIGTQSSSVYGSFGTHATDITSAWTLNISFWADNYGDAPAPGPVDVTVLVLKG